MHRRRKAYMAIDSKSAKPWDNLQQIKELHKRHLEKKKGIKERSPTDIVIKVRTLQEGKGACRSSLAAWNIEEKKVSSNGTKDEPPLVQRIIGAKVHRVWNYCLLYLNAREKCLM